MAASSAGPSGGGTGGSTPFASEGMAALIKNLLPLANSSLSVPTEGVYVGEGMPPVPAKLAKKINRGEFVEMGELLPEFWASVREDEEAKKEGKVRRSRKVTDIFTWLQCFGTYVAVRGSQTPTMIPEFMAYQSTIVRSSQDFSGLAWVRYDAAYRRQAALTGNAKWSAVNSTLYTMCFTGIASGRARCELCFATSHTEQECAQRGAPEPGTGQRLKAIEEAVLALAPQMGAGRPPVATAAEFCRKWNSNGCTFPRCRFTHKCSGCKGNHPVVECPRRVGHQGGAPTGTRARGLPGGSGRLPYRPY